MYRKGAATDAVSLQWATRFTSPNTVGRVE
jgi:hypothetical protein